MEESKPGRRFLESMVSKTHSPIAFSSLRRLLLLSFSLDSANSIKQGEGEKDVKAPNLIERAKEEIEAIMHTDGKVHKKETHGTSDDIDEDTPVDRVRAPGVFERAREEIEALVETIHPKKEPDHEKATHEGGGGFCRSLGASMEKFCSPFTGKRD